MAISRDDLNSFHQFAIARIEESAADLTFDDLAFEWDAQRHATQIDAAIRQGLQEIDQGQTKPAEQATAELRREFGPPE